MRTIDWTDPKSRISTNFTVKEALYLPSWNCYHIPTEEEKAEILKTARKMELIRKHISEVNGKDTPISVSCWIRPNNVDLDKVLTEAVAAAVVIAKDDPRRGSKQAALAIGDYNAYIGGAPRSAHRFGKAVDFSVKGMNANKVREVLLGKLDEFDICMEDHKGSWCHIDTYQRKVRYFKP